MTLPLLLILSSAAPQDARYEDRLVHWALGLYGRTAEPNPQGKRIEEILVASEDIIAPSDPWPMVANVIHTRTREATVRQQLLFEVGQPYSQAVAAETERNMRTLFIFAVARIIPVQGSTPDSVAVIVVTKDLWSLRIESEYNLIGSLPQYLRILPTEENLLGRDLTLQLDFFLKIDTLSVGELFYNPRILGTRLELQEQVDVIFNRHTQQPEGTIGSIGVDRPLFSLATEWGFAVAGTWDVETTRVFQGASVWALPYPSAAAPTDFVPYLYNTRVFQGAATYTRSYGRRWKTDLTGGYGGYVRRYSPQYDPQYTDDERAWLTANYLPWSETATYLTAAVKTYEADYQVLRDIDTFALSEDFQLGHSVLAGMRWSEPAWGSPVRYLQVAASARYRAYRYDDFFSIEAAATTRYMPGVVAAGIAPPWVNQRFAAELRNYSPTFGVGRLVTRVLFDERRNDLNHGFDFLGGDLGLRGVSAGALTGTRELLVNVEYRTRPLEVLTVHAGLVFFYDVGSAFDTAPTLVHAVGVGVRLLLPQINIQPIRIDFGYAFNGPVTPFLDRFSSSFGQVTDSRLTNFPPSFLDAPLN